MDRQALRPPFAYFGGKITLAERIASLLPPHQHYVEPFAGSLAVLFAKRPSSHETVNDLDSNIVTFWRVLRDNPQDLETRCFLTPHSREEFIASRSFSAEFDDIERARKVWVAITQSRGLSLDRTGWKFGQAKGFGRAHLDTYVGRMADAAERLRLVSIENRDAVELIRDYGAHEDVCLYLDPPYLGSTRGDKTRYGVELLGDEAHADFAAAVNECEASVVLSGYASPLYEELFDGWHRLDLKGPTTMSGDTDRVEVLWSNRPIGEPDLFSDGAA